MFTWLARRQRTQRAIDYLRIHPEDEPAVKAILAATAVLSPKNAWEVASVTAGRELGSEEWEIYGERWERAWRFIVR